MAALALLGVVSCADPASPFERLSDAFPQAADDAFELLSVDGEPLPIVYADVPGFHATLLSESIRLGPGDRYERTRTIRIDDGEPGDAYVHTDTGAGDLVLARGRVVLLQDQCGPESLALCIAPDTIVSMDQALVLRSGLPPQGLYRFRSR
jgi:hypothetical protein